MTSIFSTSWMCRLCGRETCAECFQTVNDLTTDRPGADQAEVLALQVRREKHAHNNPFFLACTRRNEHQAKDFSPMSRFCRKELSTAIDDMRKLLQQEKGKDIGNEGRTLASPPQQQSATNGESSTRQNGHGQKLNPYTGLVPSVTLHPSLQNMSDMVASNNGQNGILPSNSNPASSELSN